MEISLGKKQNYWSDLVGVAGFLKMKRKEIDDIVLKNKEISAGLEEVNLPYENFANVRSFDEIMASDEVLTTLKSAPNQLGLINRGIMKVKQFTGSGNGVTQTTNHFASIIGNQTANNFVKNSMNTLLENGFHAGTKAIISGLKGSGLKASMAGVSAAAGAISGPVGWTTGGANFLKRSFSDMSTKLGVGAKKILANNIGKIGGVLVKGLGAAVNLPTALVGSIGMKMVAPIIIGVIIVLFGLNIIQTNSNISTLVPRIETDEIGDGNEVGKPPTHGEITILEDGRIGDCGVGMDEDFHRNDHKPWIATLDGGQLEMYNKQLEEAIGSEFGKRCGVVYAAQYLAYDFDLWVPYSKNGKYNSKGLSQDWGKKTDDSEHPRKGLDCTGFVWWAQTSGYGSLVSSNPGVSFGGNCETIKGMIEPGDTLTLGETAADYHIALVIAYNDQYIKFAHSGGGSGVTTGLIDICTGVQVGTGKGNNFKALHKRYY